MGSLAFTHLGITAPVGTVGKAAPKGAAGVKIKSTGKFGTKFKAPTRHK